MPVSIETPSPRCPYLSIFSPGVAEKETYGFHDPRPGSATDTPVGKIDDGDTVALKIGKGEDQIEAFATTTVREALGTRNGSESDACEGVDADEEHSCKDVEVCDTKVRRLERFKCFE